MWSRLGGYLCITILLSINLGEAYFTPSWETKKICGLRAFFQVAFLGFYHFILKKERQYVRMRDELLGIASHELKTPLTAICLCLQLIKGKSYYNDKEKSLIQRSLDACDAMNRIIQSFLSVHCLDQKNRFPIQKRPMDLVQVIKRVMEYHPSQVKVRTPEQFHINGDPDRLFQVVDNLVSNAVKYGMGKPILICLDESLSSHFILTVCDHGIGIPEREQKNLFKSFKRVKNGQHISGTGLGLYIAWEIIKSHRGSISVESQMGKGSCFHIKFPRT